MASVQYLFDYSKTFVEELSVTQCDFNKLINYRKPFAILIQKVWRGYTARKKLRQIYRAIVTIQSFYHGWIVRKNMLTYEIRHIINLMEREVLHAVRIIQAWWRGVSFRKLMGKNLPKNRIAERERIMAVSNYMRERLHEQFRLNKIENKTNEAERVQREALYILFKCHHMLRTETRKGIYSYKGDIKEYSSIESFMRALPCKQYMDKVHEMYYSINKSLENNNISTKTPSEIDNIDSIKLHDLNRKQKKKRFILSSKIKEKPYVTSIFNNNDKSIRKPPKVDKNLLRKENGFILDLSTDLKSRDIPYHIDFWNKLLKDSYHDDKIC